MNVSNSTSAKSCNAEADSESKYILATVYILLVTLGLLGNACVIGVILRVICNKGLLTNVYLYVLCLSAVDFAYLASGPFMIYHIINGTWVFGEALCKIMYICEGLNKTLSIYILVILTFDRYLAACRPYTSAKYRSVKMAVAGLTLAAAAVTVTNTPIYMFTSVKKSPTDPRCFFCHLNFPELGQSIDDRILVSFDLRNITKPFNYSVINEVPSTWRHFATYYILFLTLAYFALPGSLILVFYARIIRRLRQQYRLVTARKNSSKRNRVAKSVLIVVSFYFFCWTPFWLLQSLITFWPSLWSMNAFVYFSYTIYTLPYVNSCSNPIFYAFLNKRLRAAYTASTRRRNRRCSGVSTSHFNASSFAEDNEPTAGTSL